MQLIKFEAAKAALVAAKTLDDVNEIKNLSAAAAAYAKMAGDFQMELDARELRVRAERKEGEILLLLKKQGVGVQGNQDPSNKRITLKEIGIKGNSSAIAQRLAMLPDKTFETEMALWKRSATGSSRLEMPLQRIRVPNARSDRQKATSRKGNSRVEHGDILDKYRDLLSGRRVADWRCGELRRIKELARRIIDAVDGIDDRMPANPDPLATMEMILSEAVLVEVLEPIWDAGLPAGDNGLQGPISVAARQSRDVRYGRDCEGCGKRFVMHRPSGKARAGKSNEGRFCSRACQHGRNRVSDVERSTQVGTRG